MAQAQNRRIFALTGGMGTGKSTVADVWRDEGLAIVDADELARQAVDPGTPALERIAAEFGREMLLPDGSLDREKLGMKVFQDAGAREALNVIVHPEVKNLARAAFDRLAREGHDLICYVIPLLVETKQQDHYRPVVVVTSTPLQQMQRVANRDGLSPTQVAARLRAQLPMQEIEAEADIMIVNSGALEDLKKRAAQALVEVKAFFSND